MLSTTKTLTKLESTTNIPLATPAPSDVSITSSQFLFDVANHASQKFLPGGEANKELQLELAEDPELREHYRKDVYYYCQPIDPFFTYNANRIKGTNFIAASGPRLRDMEIFIKDVAFNDNIKINKIIAFGKGLAVDNYESNADFYDYCSGEESEKQFGRYQVKIQRTLGNIGKFMSGENSPRGIVQSTLTITDTKSEAKEERTLQVTLFPISDGRHLDFLNDEDLQLKGWITRRIVDGLLLDAENENILVHCAAGVGRTGMIPLLYMLVKKYQEIFASGTMDEIAKKVLDELDELRENRPALLANDDQLRYTIINAGMIYKFRLDLQAKQQRLQESKKADDKEITGTTDVNVTNKTAEPTPVVKPVINTMTSLNEVYSNKNKSTVFQANQTPISSMKGGEIEKRISRKNN